MLAAPTDPELTPQPGASRARRLRPGLLRFSTTHFLGALILLFIALPFVDRPAYGELIEAVAMTVVVLSATLAVGGRTRTLAIAGLLVAPTVIAKWTEHFLPEVLPHFLVPGIAALFMTYVAFQLLSYIVRSPVVTRDVVCAGISTYLVLGLIWAFAYIVSDRLHPGSFALFGQPIAALGRLDAFYFSFITLIGIGYGDITPTSRPAQMLAVVEGITGMFFMVTLISRLVSHYSPHNRRGDAGPSSEQP